MAKHAFLFDLDGTLVITDHMYFEVWRKMLESYHIDLTPSMFNKYIYGNSDFVALQLLLPNCLGSAREQEHALLTQMSHLKDKLFCEQINDVKLVSGAVQFVKRVKEAGHHVAIVTNCNRRAAETILKHVGLDLCVDYLVIGAECERPKPSPDPYKSALKHFGVPAELAIIFEDSGSGLLSAFGVYPKCIVGISSNLTEQALVESGVDFAINGFDCIDLKTLVEYSGRGKPVTSITKYVYESMRKHWDLEGPESVYVHDQKLKGGYIADVLRLDIMTRQKGESGISERIKCVLKLVATNDTNLNKMANDLDLYGREFYFYECISPYVNINIPKFYGIVKDANLVSQGILLEDLNRSPFTLGLDLTKESVNTSLRIIDRLADLHARFWSKDLATIFPLLKKNNNAAFSPGWELYVKANWQDFENKWSAILSDKQLKVGRAIVAKFGAIQNYLSVGHLTLCHGDVKSGNIFFKASADVDKQYEPYFIDWQYITHGKGVQDLVFFMIESFDTLTMKKYNELFKNYYFVKLLEHSEVKTYDWVEYVRDFQLAACYYPFFVAVWFGVTPKEHLIDLNFPFFFIQRLFAFLEANVELEVVTDLIE